MPKLFLVGDINVYLLNLEIFWNIGWFEGNGLPLIYRSKICHHTYDSQISLQGQKQAHYEIVVFWFQKSNFITLLS